MATKPSGASLGTSWSAPEDEEEELSFDGYVSVDGDGGGGFVSVDGDGGGEGEG